MKNRNKKNHSTQDSRVVPHRGTNWAALWLTAQIGRDAVLSESYGRGYLREAEPPIYVVHDWFIEGYLLQLHLQLLYRSGIILRNKTSQLDFINKTVGMAIEHKLRHPKEGQLALIAPTPAFRSAHQFELVAHTCLYAFGFS